MRSNSFRTSPCCSGSVGSSRKSTRGLVASARAISTMWRCASESSATRLLIGMRSSSVATRARSRSASTPPPGPAERRRRKLKIFQNRQIGRQSRMLIDNRDAVLPHLTRIGRFDVFAAVVDGAGIGPQHACGNADQRRFPGAVFADDGMNLAGHDEDVDAFERLHRAEALSDVGERHDRHVRRGHRRCRDRRRYALRNRRAISGSATPPSTMIASAKSSAELPKPSAVTS